MRCLECLWSVFQLSRLCCTTASTSSMSLSLLIVVTKAGTRSMYSLVLPPPVVRVLRRAIYWVGFMFVSIRVCGFEAIAFQNRFSTVPLCVVCVYASLDSENSLWCWRNDPQASAVTSRRPSSSLSTSSTVVSNAPALSDGHTLYLLENETALYSQVEPYVFMLSVAAQRFRVTHP